MAASVNTLTPRPLFSAINLHVLARGVEETGLNTEKIVQSVTLDDYFDAANRQLEDIGTVRTATPEDLAKVYAMQKLLPEIGYQPKGINALLSHPEAINFMIEGKDPRVPVVGIAFGFPSAAYEDMLNNMNWTVSEPCPELKDPKGFYLEVKAIHPDFQGKGIYRTLRSLNELAVGLKGYERIFLHSVPGALEIHRKECSGQVRELPGYWIEDGDPAMDGYLMMIELTRQRKQKALDVLFPLDPGYN